MNLLKFILASKSPRRETLLKAIGIRPFVVPSEVDEDGILEKEGPEEAVIFLARAKAENVSKSHREDFVLGADTLVFVDGEILGKPKSDEDAKRMLRKISGRTHQVYTGVALYSPKDRTVRSDFDCTSVKIGKLSGREIDWYVSTQEPRDKAGAYALQGAGGIFVQEICGDYSSVIGLPLPKVYGLFKSAGADDDLLRGILACEG